MRSQRFACGDKGIHVTQTDKDVMFTDDDGCSISQLPTRLLLSVAKWLNREAEQIDTVEYFDCCGQSIGRYTLAGVDDADIRRQAELLEDDVDEADWFEIR